jgi:hypothetical protein
MQEPGEVVEHVGAPKVNARPYIYGLRSRAARIAMTMTAASRMIEMMSIVRNATA